MSSKSNVRPASALHEILAWSNARPDWQRDALRRIVVNEEISETDMNELESICRAKYRTDTSSDPVIAVEPLTAAHLPPAPGAAESVSLVTIGELKHVNRLPSDQVIPFGATPGLTVIYGDNGSGKSGYARVIKKACRARGAPPIIRADAFSTTASGKASAAIVFSIAGTNVPVAWTDGVSPDPRLANVFVFDSFSAGHYVNDDSPAAFTPYGLDVLPTLSKTCDALRERLQQDINQTNTAITTVATNWKYDAATVVGKLVSKLSATSKEADVNALSGLDAKQLQRFQDLREALNDDPLQKAKETRAAAMRLGSFATKVATIAGELADDKVEALRKLVDEVKTTEAAAKAFASGQFDGSYLDGTGNELWRAMWEAGREYSVSDAYKEQAFPYTSDRARCVLCQQDIDEEADKRLKAFESFCTDKSQQVAAQAAKRLTAVTEKLALVEVLSPELEKVDADLAGMTPEQRAALSEFASKTDERLKTIRNNIAKRIWDVPVALLSSPEVVIKGKCVELEARAETEESAHVPEARKKLVVERSELEAREWLAGVKEDVLVQIERYKAIAMLESCQKDANTTAITTKSTELTKLFVTEAFRDRFSAELKALGLCTLAVTLELIQGKKGETKFGLRLTSTSGHKVVDIASEGEQRCIALAAFMAELSQASHQSSLVFDDPVSSLDHWRREKIAVRLVVESKNRQVIVFTHDSVFLNDLQSNATRSGLVPEICHLEWSGGTPGKYVKGLPWDMKTVDDRFSKLEKEQKAITTAWNPVPNEDNVQSMRRSYSWLRATLERMVEKEIFSDVVFRFRSYVDIKKLDGVVGFSPIECAELQRLVQRCHDVTDAHDPAQAKQAAIPVPADLAADIAAAKKLLAEIRIRRKAATGLHAVPITQPGTP